MTVGWYRWSEVRMWPQHVPTMTFSLPLAAYLGCLTLLSHHGYSRLSLERLLEGLFGQEGKNSLLPGLHSFAVFGVEKETNTTIIFNWSNVHHGLIMWTYFSTLCSEKIFSLSEERVFTKLRTTAVPKALRWQRLLVASARYVKSVAPRFISYAIN